MHEYKKALGMAVRKARKERDLTQAALAKKLNIDVRSIMNIENYRGNPKFDLLCPLINELRIPCDKVFHPTATLHESYKIQLLNQLEICEEDEIEALFPLIQQLISFYRNAKNS